MASAAEKISLLEAKGAFGMHVLLFDRVQFVPERESARDDQSDENADQKEPAIRRQRDQQNRYYNNRDDKSRRSPQAEAGPAVGFRFHEFILARLSGLAAINSGLPTELQG
jgi:hypothetical protein